MNASYGLGRDRGVNALEGQTIAVLGYGRQGRAHALNLRESGARVLIGLRPEGASRKLALEDGFGSSLHSVAEVVREADLVCFLLPDMVQPSLYLEEVASNLREDAALLFAHGLSIHYRMIVPSGNHDVILVAPKGPGALVRRQFQEGKGVPCLIAVHQNTSGKAKEKAHHYAHMIGGTRAGILETSFKEETETDLFGEQAVLCGGATELVKAGFETLVAAGYQPELAYFECMHELKLIVDLLYEGGLTKMHEFISDTAKYGTLESGTRVIDKHVRQNMQEILNEIQDGRFAARWKKEYDNGLANYRNALSRELHHPIEEIGRGLRSQMSWLQKQAGGDEHDRS